MNGLLPREFFTLRPAGGPAAAARADADWRRLSAALLVSCALHLALLLTPYLGGGAGLHRAREDRILRVRLVPAPRPETVPAAPQSPRPSSPRPRGAELLPVPAPTFYTADRLTKRPRPLSEPNLYVAWDVAHAVTGKVILQVWVGALGSVDAVEVEQSDLPEAVSSTVAKAFRRLRFEPGEIEGRRVPSLLRIEVTYDQGRVQH